MEKIKITKKDVVITTIEIISIVIGATSARIVGLLLTKALDKATK